MSIYRCAVCGSSRVVPETKQEGYNKKKGFLGMALFGVGGAVAGAGGNTVTYYHCAACGQTLNRCMSDFDKNNIDRYLSDPNNEANQTFLKTEKKKYPNIEWEEPIVVNNDNVEKSAQEKFLKECKEREESKTVIKKAKPLDKYAIAESIINALYKAGKPCTVAEMPIIETSCRKYNNQQLWAIVRLLTDLNIVKKIESEEERKIYFEANPNSKEEAMELLSKFEDKIKSDEPQSKPLDKYAIAMSIINALYKTEEPCTIAEMKEIEESCKEYPNMYMAAVAKNLTDINILERVCSGQKAYFKIITSSKEEAIKLLDRIKW